MRFLLAVLVLQLARTAVAEPVGPPELHPLEQPRGLTVQGNPADAPAEVEPMLPLALTAPLALAVDAGGLFLVIPELSFRHVLGFQHDARRTRGYLGLGLMTLSPVVGLALSGARPTTAAVGGLVEGGAIGVAFGFAFLADLAFRGGTLSAPNGVFPALLATAGALVAAGFPIAIAFTNGRQVDADEDAQHLPSLGMVPLPGGAALVVAGRF